MVEVPCNDGKRQAVLKHFCLCQSRQELHEWSSPWEVWSSSGTEQAGSKHEKMSGGSDPAAHEKTKSVEYIIIMINLK